MKPLDACVKKTGPFLASLLLCALVLTSCSRQHSTPPPLPQSVSGQSTAALITPPATIALTFPGDGVMFLEQSADLATWSRLVATNPLILQSTTTRFFRSANPPAAIRLEWDASPDATVAGYVILWKSADGNSAGRVSVGNVTTATLSNLPPACTVTVLAVAANGIESLPSNPVCIQPATNITLTRL